MHSEVPTINGEAAAAPYGNVYSGPDKDQFSIMPNKLNRVTGLAQRIESGTRSGATPHQ